MGLKLVLTVLSSFLKIGVISAYVELAGYSELDKALLKLYNIKHAIRSRFYLITLTGIFEAWEAFLSLSKATSLRVSSKVTKWKLNLGRPFSLIFLLIEMILWWCLYFSTTSNTGFIRRSVFPRDIEILNNTAKVVIKRISYICVWAKNFPILS